MSCINIIAATTENTVVTEFEPRKSRSGAYQSEAELEEEFIQQLVEQGYEYLPIHCEEDLIANLRARLEALNSIKFTNAEWSRFFHEIIANKNDGIVEKTRRIQEDYKQVLRRDDGTSQNIRLIDKENIHNNSLQVINQYEIGEKEGARRDNRYDATILVNGLPLVHVELKRRGVALKEAFNQIDRYQRDSFWAGSGLYEYVQIFVISNGTETKYYSNTTRFNAAKNAEPGTHKAKTSHSFEFTSYWSDFRNNLILDLVDFTAYFFAKHTILKILTKYCVFTAENMLLVMRPYQIAATERILERIAIANNYKKYGSKEGGGYIWHTTGSGKTLTSFKTAQLATDLPYIDKVLFVVDRKDLDYQTMKEYDRYKKGAANSNTSTKILQQQLEDPKPEAKIIITTIQKLAVFIKNNPGHAVYQKPVVIIFDECHRSQFGDMHKQVVNNFKNYYLFGFTGTPIFSQNAGLSTTQQTFGDRLHQYTIDSAIKDHNVLPFRIDYLSTVKNRENGKDELVYDIDRPEAIESPQRVSAIVSYILEHFDQKTYRNNKSYEHNVVANVSDVVAARPGAMEEKKRRQRLNGFNAILATESIDMAKRYYSEFQRQMKKDPANGLKIALIYSYAANEEEKSSGGHMQEENSEDTSKLDQSSRDFLSAAINDYNGMFHTNFDTDKTFQNYYKDLSLRMKNREIDLLIVVNMFLTGFDATTLNTMWVDKDLKYHGLIQAFSRTNRILNSVKPFGNIVCFRNLRENVEKAIALFGNPEAGGIVILRVFKDYYEGYTDNAGEWHPGYKDMVKELRDSFPLESRIEGEKNIRRFVSLFGQFLRMRHLLLTFDEFKGNELISDRDRQDYQSRYMDFRPKPGPKPGAQPTSIVDDLVFELELIKQEDINVDYILAMVEKYSSPGDKEILIDDIRKAVDASPELRSKKELIEQFLAEFDAAGDVRAGWREFIARESEREIKQIIAEERLREPETRKLMVDAFRDGEVTTTGTGINAIMPPMSRFDSDESAAARALKKQMVTDKLLTFFGKFFDVGVPVLAPV